MRLIIGKISVKVDLYLNCTQWHTYVTQVGSFHCCMVALVSLLLCSTRVLGVAYSCTFPSFLHDTHSTIYILTHVHHNYPHTSHPYIYTANILHSYVPCTRLPTHTPLSHTPDHNIMVSLTDLNAQLTITTYRWHYIFVSTERRYTKQAHILQKCNAIS